MYPSLRNGKILAAVRLERAEDLVNRQARSIAAIIVVCGLVWRLYYVSDFYMNPDEALHYLVASHAWHGLVGFYRNATRTLHPPLFIPVLQGMLLTI